MIKLHYPNHYFVQLMSLNQKKGFLTNGWGHINDLGFRSRTVSYLDNLISRETLWGALQGDNPVYNLHLIVSSKRSKDVEVLLMYFPHREQLLIFVESMVPKMIREFLKAYLSWGTSCPP